MTAIVEDLLLLARSDSGAVELERVPVDLGDVAADGASALGKPATDRGVRVEVDPQPAVVTGDPARLRQLVMILVDNAIRHSPTDGRVGVAVRADGGGATLTVEDDGPGIRPEDLPHVFERFYRAPGAPGGGTGLGLAIAAWIVDRHGGRIEVANRPRAAPASWSACRPRAGPLRRSSSPRSPSGPDRRPGQLAGEPVAWAMSEAAASIGIAKPRPWASVETAVLMPMTAPVGVEQRSAAVARVDRGVGLEEAGQRLRPAGRLVGDGDRPVRWRTGCPWSRSR